MAEVIGLRILEAEASEVTIDPLCSGICCK